MKIKNETITLLHTSQIRDNNLTAPQQRNKVK